MSKRAPGLIALVSVLLVAAGLGACSSQRDAAVQTQAADPMIAPDQGAAQQPAAQQPQPPPPPPAVPLSFQAPFLLSASSLVGVELERLPTDRRIVALTFDAGGNADALPAVLQTLQANNVPATFFLTGDWMTRYPEQTRLLGQSYPLGNHSMTHPNFTSLTEAQMRSEVEAATQLITAASGRDPRPLFRFPSGDRDARTTRAVNDMGYSNIRWTIDTLGWMGTSAGITQQRVMQRVQENLQPGMIILMHVGSHPTDGSLLDSQALPAVIDYIRGQGYDFVSLLGAPS